MSWHRVCKIEEVPRGSCRTVELEQESLLVCRTDDGAVHAVEDVCTHDDGPLGEGTLEGLALECPRHGARFDVTTGAVLRLPAATPLRTFPVRVAGEWVELGMEGAG
jgi:3-phenylpropionate/trans-cinnamate dioxygenase ferredoxin subunit